VVGWNYILQIKAVEELPLRSRPLSHHRRLHLLLHCRWNHASKRPPTKSFSTELARIPLKNSSRTNAQGTLGFDELIWLPAFGAFGA
jgi:hypothetical protein